MFELDKDTNLKCCRCPEQAQFQVSFEIKFCAEHFLEFTDNMENNKKEGLC